MNISTAKDSNSRYIGQSFDALDVAIHLSNFVCFVEITGGGNAPIKAYFPEHTLKEVCCGDDSVGFLSSLGIELCSYKGRVAIVNEEAGDMFLFDKPWVMELVRVFG